MVIFQQTKQNKSPFIQVAVRPQSKNENSDFNEWVSEACLEAQDKLRSLGYLASYVGSANDGILCNHLFVVEKLFDILWKKYFVLSSNPNHNVKNCRYQLVLG